MNSKIDQDLLNRLESIKQYCKVECPHLERWPSYFDRRFYEFISYLEIMPSKKWGNVLELGCGVGYQSAFLAQISENVVATDLPDEDMSTHTPGMVQAKQLHKELNIQNVKLIGCSAEALPFPDESFDMVFSSHVLEHIPDQKKALNEIYRVLKPGGINFCVVPASFDKTYSFLNYYIYLVQRSFYHVYRKVKPSAKANDVKEIDSKKEILKSTAGTQLKYFPFPPPHGHSSHFLKELKNWTPSEWRKKAKNDAPFDLIYQGTTQVNPLLPMLGGLFPLLSIKIHANTRKFERNIGKLKFVQWMGINSVMVFRKALN